MKYQEISPASHLQDIIRNYWLFEVSNKPDQVIPVHHEILPEMTVSVVCLFTPHFRSARLLGPQLSKYESKIFPPSRYLGIRFQPWVQIAQLFPDKSELINQTKDIKPEMEDYFSDILELLPKEFPAISELEQIIGQVLKDGQIIKKRFSQIYLSGN